MQLTGSEILVECLKEQGVDTVFGYPGGAILNIYDALYKHSGEIRHILTSHEQGAAHAADGYARATGKVGVCMATSGPGATNLVTGIATAYGTGNCILMTAACYLCCYLLALFRSQKKFRKMNIHDLMDSQRQNEEIKETHEKAKRWFLPLSVLFLVVFGVFLFCFKAWDTGVVIAFLIGLVLTIYLFYTGIAAWIACYVRKKGAAIYRGMCGVSCSGSFLRRSGTLRFTMGTLTALFTLAILGSSWHLCLIISRMRCL